jgi:uncharacterized protein DUF6089
MNFNFMGKSLAGLPIFILLSTQFLFGQSTEIGGGFVGALYTGDLSRNIDIRETRPGISLYYRKNFNDYFSLRYNLTGSLLHGDDQNPLDSFAVLRDQSFDIKLIEAAAMVEYHFLNYHENPARLNWSPYIFAGIGAMTFFGGDESPNDFNKFQPVIPFGGGIKYLLNWKWTLVTEFGARKTFFDYLDNVSEGDLALKNYQYGNQYINDWYYFISVTVSYTFHIVPCPFGDYN